MFAVQIYRRIDFLRGHAKASFDVKMVVLFGFTTFPYLLNILFWDQLENAKKAAVEQQRREIKVILFLN